MSQWIGVDLDGTLAYHEKWIGLSHIGEPIPLMLDRVKQWLSYGLKIKIFTARATRCHTSQQACDEVCDPIREWCLKHIGVELEITNVKDYDMIELWDDRAVGVIENTGKIKGTAC